MDESLKNQIREWIPFVLLLLLSLILILLYSLSPRLLQTWYEKTAYAWVHGVLSLLILLGSLGTLAISYYSYPRIQNLKIYLLGYTFFLTGLFIWGLTQSSSPELRKFLLVSKNFNLKIPLYFIICFNFWVVTFAQEFTKYKRTKMIAASLLILEFIILLPIPQILGRLCSPQLLKNFNNLSMAYYLIPLSFVLLFIIFSRMKMEHGLGGTLAGLLVLFCISAFSSSSDYASPKAMMMEKICFGAFYLFLPFGLMMNWLARVGHRVTYDPLLKIYNRDYFSRIAAETANINLGKNFCVAMIDIDHFKKVNDTYGHEMGDVVLYELAQTIKQQAMPKGITCRYGGEEIAIFFPKTEIEEAFEIAEGIRIAVKSHSVRHKGKTVSPTVSIGVGMNSSRYETVQQLIQATDKALYRAKVNGRNRTEKVR